MLVQPSQLAHGVKHPDALKPVVDRAFGAELGMRAQQGELKSQARERAFQARGDLGDDLLEAARLDFQAGDEICQKLDERLRVAVKRAAGDDERLEVVIADRQGLDLRRGSDPPGDGGDPAGDLRVVLARRATVRQRAAEQRQQVFLFGREHGEVAADVEVGDAIRRLGIELDSRPLHGGVPDRDILELHRDVAEL